MDKKISQRITILSFFMTLAIMSLHATSKDSQFEWILVNAFDEKMNIIAEQFFSECGSLAMRFFFATTGFLLFSNYSISKYWVKMKKRVVSLFIPYLIWQFFALIHTAIYSELPGVNDLIRSLFLFDWPLNGPLWYIYAVFILAFLSPCIFVFFRNEKLGFCFILCLSLGIFSADWGQIGNYGYIGNILNYISSYFLGAFFGYFSHKEDKEWTARFLFYFLAGAWIWNILQRGAFQHIIISLLPVMILYYAPVVPCLVDLPVYRCTFVMYASHILLLPHLMATVYRFVNYVMPFGFLANISGRIICILLCAVCSFIFCVVMERIWPKGLGILTGGRALTKTRKNI